MTLILNLLIIFTSGCFHSNQGKVRSMQLPGVSELSPTDAQATVLSVSVLGILEISFNQNNGGSGAKYCNTHKTNM